MTIEIDKQGQTVVFRTSENAEHRYSSGDIIGESYQLIDLIGQGGMGVVYRVHHLILDKHFALKLLAPNQINNHSWRRFETEGRALAKLNHANIVSIYNMGIDRGCPYFVMDWLEGMSLAERIAESGPLDTKDSLEIFLQICSGLSCAHKNGIIHRDVKPANIMLLKSSKGTEVKIVDFGIARLQSIDSAGRQALTAYGEVFGSPLYMSPEQTRGEQLDGRSDLYSLGCSLFETLTGQVPFRGRSALATMNMHQEAEPPRLSTVLTRKNVNSAPSYSADPEANSSINQSLDLLLARCLNKDIEKRYQSADQISVDLQRIAEGKPIGRDSLRSSNDRGINADSSHERLSASREAEQRNNSFSSGKARLRTILIAVPLLALLVIAIALRPNKAGQQANQQEQATIVDRPSSEAQSATGLNKLKEALGDKGRDQIALTAENVKILNNYPDISAGVKPIKGKRMRCFHFPTTVSIGEIEGLGEGQSRIQAKGEVLIPAELNIYLRLNSIINKCPVLLDKFHVEDINSLRLNGIEPAGPVLEHLSNWTKLTKLTIDNNVLSDSDLRSLDKLEHLKSLEIRAFAFNWQPFTKLKLLKHLNALHLSNSEQLNPILQNLPPLPELQTLELSGQAGQWLTQDSVTALAKQTNLKTLSLKTKETGLERVLPNSTNTSDEQNLKQLPVTEWVSAFKQLNHLEKLEIARPDASDERVQNFLSQVPAARSNYWATKFGYNQQKYQ